MFKIGQKVRVKESITHEQFKQINLGSPNYHIVFVQERKIFHVDKYSLKSNWPAISLQNINTIEGWTFPEAWLESADKGKPHPLTDIFKDLK